MAHRLENGIVVHSSADMRRYTASVLGTIIGDEADRLTGNWSPMICASLLALALAGVMWWCLPLHLSGLCWFFSGAAVWVVAGCIAETNTHDKILTRLEAYKSALETGLPQLPREE